MTKVEGSAILRDNYSPRPHRVPPTLTLFGIAVGVLVLFLPWPVRLITEMTGRFSSLKVTHLNLLAALILGSVAARAFLRGIAGASLIRRHYRFWYATLAYLAVGMLGQGLFHKAPAVLLMQELIPVILFGAGLVLGLRRVLCKRIVLSYLYGATFIGIPVIVIGISRVGSLAAADLLSGLVYTTSAILVPSTFFAFLFFARVTPRQLFMGAASLSVYAASQILFVKRAPTLRIAVALVIALAIGGTVRRRRVSQFMAMGALLLGGLALAVGTSAGRTAVSHLGTRLGMLDAIPAIVMPDLRGPGLSGDLRSESFRAREVVIFLDNMNRLERVIGMGLGSYVVDPRLNESAVLESTESPVQGKASLHIGMFWAVVKGGWILFVILYGGIVAVILSRNRFRSDDLANTCWAFVLLTALFSAVEGLWMQPGVELTTFLMGASVACCISSDLCADDSPESILTVYSR